MKYIFATCVLVSLATCFLGVSAIPTADLSCTDESRWSHLRSWADVTCNMVRHTPWPKWPIQWPLKWCNAVTELCSRFNNSPTNQIEDSRRQFPGSRRSWSWLTNEQWNQMTLGAFVRVPRDAVFDVSVLADPYRKNLQYNENFDEDSFIELYYQVHGNGPRKILFMMGFVGPHSAWIEQIKHYSSPEMASQYQICVYDHRGVGFSSSPVPRQGEWGYKTSDMARDAFYLVRHLNWDRFHLVGYSLGGMVAQEFALAHPSLVQSLTLVSTHTGRTHVPLNGFAVTATHLFKLASPFHILVELCFPPEFLSLKPNDAVDAAKYPTNREKYYALLQHLFQISPPHSALGIYGQFMSIHSHAMSRANLVHLRKIPTQVLLGSRDNLVPPACTRRVAEQLQARVVIFEGSGHLIPMERRDEFHRVLEAHFDLCHNRELDLPPAAVDDGENLTSDVDDGETRTSKVEKETEDPSPSWVMAHKWLF